jgi:hypothetical protein
VRRRLPPLLLAPALVTALHGTSPPALAQTQGHPHDLLQRGRDLYEDQQYEESIQTLSGALVRPDNTLAQKIEIYRLLALDHITLGHKEEAENVVRALLALQPDYALPRTESPRFRDFFAAVRAKWEADGRPGLASQASAPEPVTLRHSSPSEAAPDHEITLTATVDGPGRRARQVEVFYRTGARGRFTELTAQFAPADGSARVTLPASAVQPPYVAYYLLARDAAGLPVASSGDAEAPLRIPVPEPSRGWVLPVVITGAVVGVTGIVLGSLALAGVFKPHDTAQQSTVTIGVMSFR